MSAPSRNPRPRVRPVVLLILDGFGAREDAPDNAITRADMPNWRRLLREAPHTTIDASERHVGLPAGQMGNSEVGHLNIGAGRVVYQDFTRIDHAIETGEFAGNPALDEAIVAARVRGATLHVLGLLSPGGVHSHERQIAAMVELAAQRGARSIAVHAFLDGRDTPPKSAAASIAFMERICAQAGGLVAPTVSRHDERYGQQPPTGNRSPAAAANDAPASSRRVEHAGGARIASICGRYYAMDRDKRWERVAAAYELLVEGEAPYTAKSAREALDAAYARGETDEFVKPTAILDRDGNESRIDDGDAVVFMNFRADRARQLTRALTDADFDGFPRARVPKLSAYVTLTSYGDEFAHLAVAFPPQTVTNSFGEYIASLGLTQLRIAETEKYAHVTYFFNGGTESVYAGEDRIMVPSPKVATYDLKPEMSAPEVTERLVAAIESGRYDAIVCNFANADMVGHTGNFAATVKAIEALDACIGRVVAAARAAGGEVLITSDHGNAEMTDDATTGQPHTAHTLNVVPVVYVGRRGRLDEGGELQDVAPTLLTMMGLPQPPEMTGRSLLRPEE